MVDAEDTIGSGAATGDPTSTEDDAGSWAEDDANLDSGLASLARLSSDRLGLEELLTRVADYAVRAIPGADGAGLTLLEEDRADIVVKTTEFVRQVDDIQYRLGEGPCIDAARRGITVTSGSLEGDLRWPRFGPRAGRLGVHSVLSLPLITPAGVAGAMNVYAYGHDVFDERAERLGEVFAGPAGVTVHNAQILAQTARLVEQLQTALATRPVIDQAIGILRARGGIDAREAFNRLRILSQTQHVKLAVVAETVVDEAVRRARSRRTPPS